MRQFKPPPQETKFIEPENTVDPRWAQWFEDIYRKLSIKNHQTITAAQAIDADAQYVALKTVGATYAVTLEAPTIAGAYKIIEMTADSGHNVTLALTNVIGGTASSTCTWDDVNDTLILASVSNKWVVIKQHGVTLS